MLTRVEFRRKLPGKEARMTKVLLSFGLTLAVVALVGCGGGGGSSSAHNPHTYCPKGNQGGPHSGQILKLAAVPSGAPKFQQKTLTANKPGQVTIEFNNPSPRCHDVAVKAEVGGKVYGATASPVKKGKISVGLNLPAGKYSYYSTRPGERDAGMLGTLIVKR
jgi:plastocyanin